MASRKKTATKKTARKKAATKKTRGKKAAPRKSRKAAATPRKKPTSAAKGAGRAMTTGARTAARKPAAKAAQDSIPRERVYTDPIQAILARRRRAMLGR